MAGVAEAENIHGNLAMTVQCNRGMDWYQHVHTQLFMIYLL